MLHNFIDQYAMTPVTFWLDKICLKVLFFTKTHFITSVLPIVQNYKRIRKMWKTLFFHPQNPVALRWIQPKNSAGEELKRKVGKKRLVSVLIQIQ